MSVAPHQIQRPEPAEMAAILPAEARELQSLYDRLPSASSAAAQALRSAGSAPEAAAFQRFRELDAYVETIVDRIREILGR